MANNGTIQKLGNDHAVRPARIDGYIEIYAPVSDNVEQPMPFTDSIVLTDEQAVELATWILNRQQSSEYDFVSILVRLLWERRITPDAGELVIRSLVANACNDYIKGWIGEPEV